MAPETTPGLSVLVSTRNRASFLGDLLDSLQTALIASPIGVEIVVIDNGSTDETERVIEEWHHRLPGLMHLVEEQPGKTRALNRCLQVARAPLLAFVDDDVRVAADWVATISAFFTDHPDFDAATGRVCVAQGTTDQSVLTLLARYRTLPLYDGSEPVWNWTGLTGCNMALRRKVFDVIGPFNERLGPGASGAHEDADLALRVRAAGMRIAYLPNAIVYHAVDPQRLTPEFFREFHRRMAHSHYAVDPRHAWRKSAGRLPGVLLGFTWWSLLGNATRRTRAWGRLIQHSEVVRLRWRDGWKAREPIVDWAKFTRGS